MMTMSKSDTTVVGRSSARRKDRGFTIIEVAIAGFVLAIAIVSALYALQMGFKMVETARNTALADQVLQSQIEDLRLKSWAGLITTYPGSTAGITYDLTSSLDANVKAQGITLSLTVTLSTTYSETATLMVTSSWNSTLTKRKLTRSYQTVYSRNGISDYFVSTHS